MKIFLCSLLLILFGCNPKDISGKSFNPQAFVSDSYDNSKYGRHYTVLSWITVDMSPDYEHEWLILIYDIKAEQKSIKRNNTPPLWRSGTDKGILLMYNDVDDAVVLDVLAGSIYLLPKDKAAFETYFQKLQQRYGGKWTKYYYVGDVNKNGYDDLVFYNRDGIGRYMRFWTYRERQLKNYYTWDVSRKIGIEGGDNDFRLYTPKEIGSIRKYFR